MRLYEPLEVLEPFGDELWIVNGPLARMPLGPGVTLPFPTRMTVVRLGNGTLLLHSPTQFSEALAARVCALGRPAHLVSPNLLHYENIPSWKRAFPDAFAWASPGVRERAASRGVDFHFDRDLEDAPPDEWRDDCDQLLFAGGRWVHEVVFFHRRSRTLIVTDLIQNFERERLTRSGALLARAGGALHPDGQTPLDFRATFFGRGAQVRKNVERMLAWRPERIALAHGRPYERDGTAELRRAMRWAL